MLRDLGDASPWREVVDEYTGASDRFHERHYNEFVSFLPYVQRFLYGEGRKGRAAGGADGGDSPMRVFRRSDIAARARGGASRRRADHARRSCTSTSTSSSTSTS